MLAGQTSAMPDEELRPALPRPGAEGSDVKHPPPTPPRAVPPFDESRATGHREEDVAAGNDEE